MGNPRAAQAAINVKIGAFPGGQIKSYDFPAGTTYQEGLTKAGLNGTRGESLDVRVNGTRISSLNGPMEDKDQVLVFSKVRGN